MILGPLAAFELLAITDYVRDNATPLISLAAAEDVTQRKANPFVIRPSATSAQCCHVMGDYAAKELKYKRAATISEDFAFGYEQMAGFQRVFEDDGGKVVKKLWPPLVTPDYTPYIAQIGNVDCVFNGFAGSNPVKFMRAYADLGLKGKIPLLGRLDRHGRRAAARASATRRSASISAHWYSADLDTPSNKRFVADDGRRTTACCPAAIRPACTSPANASRRRSQKLGGKADDRKALAEALHQVTLTDTPRGPVKFDHLGNVVGDVFIRKCERKDGKLVNTVDQDLSERQPVLDLRREGVPGGSGLLPRLSAGEEPGVARDLLTSRAERSGDAIAGLRCGTHRYALVTLRTGPSCGLTLWR